MCAAIEACEQGSAVTVLERFTGVEGPQPSVVVSSMRAEEPTSRLRLGSKDDVAAMHAYLAQETEGVISEETLTELSAKRAPIIFNGSHVSDCNSRLHSARTRPRIPNDDYFLYYSGNEAADPYRQSSQGRLRAGIESRARAFRVGISSAPSMITSKHWMLESISIARSRNSSEMRRNNVDGRFISRRFRVGSGPDYMVLIEAWAHKNFALFLPPVARGHCAGGARR